MNKVDLLLSNSQVISLAACKAKGIGIKGFELDFMNKVKQKGFCNGNCKLTLH